MPLTGLQKLAQQLDQFDVDKTVQNIIESNKEKLEDLQREQLASGKDANGKFYKFNGRESYSPFTIHQKEKYGVGIGRITDHFTLYNSGDMYRFLTAKLKENSLDFQSNVPYFSTVIKQVGTSVIGLNEESRQVFFDKTFFPAFKKLFEKETGIKLTR